MDKLTIEQLKFIRDVSDIVKENINFQAQINEETGTISVFAPLTSSFNADVILKYQRAFNNSLLPREKFVAKAAEEIKEMMELGY